MSRSKQSSETAARLARLFSPHVAFATAPMAEAFLAEKWSVEQSKMMQRGDTRKVSRIAADDFEMMREARKLVPPDAELDLIAMNRVLALLTGFPPDAMWKAAFTVAWRVGVCGLLGQRQRFHDCLPDSARAPQIRDLL
jgi:hypothetical protein